MHMHIHIETPTCKTTYIYTHIHIHINIDRHMRTHIDTYTYTYTYVAKRGPKSINNTRAMPTHTVDNNTGAVKKFYNFFEIIILGAACINMYVF